MSDPELAVMSNTIQFSAYENREVPGSQKIYLENDGDGKLNWSAGSDQAWLKVAPENGEVGFDAQERLTLTVGQSACQIRLPTCMLPFILLTEVN